MLTDPTRDPTLYRLSRSLLPSGISGLLCLFFGALVVGIWVLSISLEFGTSLPHLFDGEWSVLYTNTVLQPLLTVIHNPIINKLLFVLLFGIAGLAIYFLGNGASATIANWREAQHFIRVAPTGAITHPGIKLFVITLLFRLFVLMAALYTGINLVPLLTANTAALAPLVVTGMLPFYEIAAQLLLSVVTWTVAAHLFVVALRLVLLRMRLFGN